MNNGTLRIGPIIAVAAALGFVLALTWMTNRDIITIWDVVWMIVIILVVGLVYWAIFR